MFTGLVEATGQISLLQAIGGDVRLHIVCSKELLADVQTGASICVSGVCLTALFANDAALEKQEFFADVSNETLRVTSLGSLNVGSRVNLERALLPSTRMGGHFVSGHVDGLAKVQAIDHDGRSQRWRFAVPTHLAPMIASKGSVCLDGVSLTVNDVFDDSFTVNLIPHTLAVTSLSERTVGDVVNLEVDLLARYVARLQQFAKHV